MGAEITRIFHVTLVEHLLLLWNGQSNKIIIDKERYMKSTVIDLETTSEPSLSEFPIFGIFSMDYIIIMMVTQLL
jgi:hypothetical protein